MNKKLLMAAVGAALVAGPMVAAQADAKVYGKAHISVADFKSESSTTAPGNKGQTVVSSNASRLGFKFSEDLGGGLKAVGQYEATIGMSSGDQSFIAGTRNTYLGLSGDFGTVLAGTHDTPFKIVGRGVELMPEYFAGDARSITAPGGAAGWDLRSGDVIAYVSPDMTGFQVLAAYITDTSGANPDNNDTDATSIAATYKSGPLYVGIASETHNISTTDDESGVRLAASYDFGAAKVTAFWQSLDDVGAGNYEQDAMGLGVAVPFGGNNALKVQYYTADDRSNLADSGATMTSVAWDHKFSKTVTTYVMYGKTDNDAAAAFSVTGATTGTVGEHVAPFAGRDPKAFALGMIMDF